MLPGRSRSGLLSWRHAMGALLLSLVVAVGYVAFGDASLFSAV